MLKVISLLVNSVVSLSLIVIVFSASPSFATVPSNEELHKMIVGVMQKMETLQSENRTLKKQLASLKQGKTYASLSPQHSNGVVPASVRRELSPIKAVVRNVKQVPQVATSEEKREPNVVAKPNNKPSKYYASLNLEYAIPEDVSVQSRGTTGDASLADGVGIGLNWGYRFNNNIRGEIEFTRRVHELQNIPTRSNSSSRLLSGQAELYTTMMNGYYDLSNDSVLKLKSGKFWPYIGAGVGATLLRANDVTSSLEATGELDNSATRLFNGSIWLPAGQIMAGFTHPISDKLDFDLGYRFFLMGDIAGTVDGQSGDSGVFRSHSLKLGMRYNIN
jgi:opacity protein-like surface antigen